MSRLFAGGPRLKPMNCPFCGGKARVMSEHPSVANQFVHRVECTECKCQTPGCKLPQLAVFKWNSRRHINR